MNTATHKTSDEPTMTASLDQRLNELEVRIAFIENTVQTLDATVVAQDRMLQLLRREFENLRGELVQVQGALAQVQEALKPFDPRPHWGKVFHLDRDEVRRHYPRLADFRALAERHDPDRKFGNAFLETYVY